MREKQNCGTFQNFFESYLAELMQQIKLSEKDFFE